MNSKIHQVLLERLPHAAGSRNAETDGAVHRPAINCYSGSDWNASGGKETICTPLQAGQEHPAALADEQKRVAAAQAAVDAAALRHQRAQQTSMQALLAAKSATTRALLLEVAAKRAMLEAIAVAKKARSRVTAARQAARDARQAAETIQHQVKRFKKSETTAAVDLVCAEERLENAKAGLQSSIHNLIVTRNCEPALHLSNAISGAQIGPGGAASAEAVSRRRILADLLEIEAALKAVKPIPRGAGSGGFAAGQGSLAVQERRRHRRLVFPVNQRPLFWVGDRSISVLDLSANGVGLETDAALAASPIVRGVIALKGQRSIQVVGKRVRTDDHALGLKLVTRIDRQTLEKATAECGDRGRLPHSAAMDRPADGAFANDG